MHLAEIDAVHAVLVARLPDARARLEAAVVELRHALIGLEALARLTGCSDGQALGIFIPPVARGPDLTVGITAEDLLAAMCWLADLEAPSRCSATVIPFPTR